MQKAAFKELMQILLHNLKDECENFVFYNLQVVQILLNQHLIFSPSLVGEKTNFVHRQLGDWSAPPYTLLLHQRKIDSQIPRPELFHLSGVHFLGSRLQRTFTPTFRRQRRMVPFVERRCVIVGYH